MGGAFWVGCGWFFFGPLVGGGRGWSGWGRENDRVRSAGSFVRWTTRIVKHSHFLCYMFYVEQWGFHYIMLQDNREECPRPRCLRQTRARWSFNNLTTSSTHWREWKDWCTSFHHSLHGTVGMVSYTHEVYVICYFCYMLFNTHLCIHIIPFRTGGGT